MKDQLALDVNAFADAIDSRLAVPISMLNNVLVTTSTGAYTGHPVFKPTAIIENDTDLEAQKNVTDSFANVFNWWPRISRGGPTYTDNYLPAELDSWVYDNATDQIRNTTNSLSIVGFISPDKYEDYVFDVQVSSTAPDDDHIGLIIAHALDRGTGNTHILTASRQGMGRAPLIIDKDLNALSNSRYPIQNVMNGLTWITGEVATGYNNGGVGAGNWNNGGIGARIKVTRQKDIITVETSQFKSSELFEPAKFTFDLSADPQLEVFRGPQSFGYVALSQQNSTWKVNQKPEMRIPIIDTRDWSKWTFANNTWTKVPGTKAKLIADGLLAVNWLHYNAATNKFYYMDNLSQLYRV